MIWNYDKVTEPYPYGEETTYKLGMAFLDGCGSIEDWGCGLAYAKKFVTQSNYTGLDITPSKFADKVMDLETYKSNTDCIFMRHVLEHNHNWKIILKNAIDSFQQRMVIILFTPLSMETHDLNGTPDYSFNLQDILEFLKDFTYKIEKIRSDTQYGEEHVIYVERAYDKNSNHSGNTAGVGTAKQDNT